MGQGFDIFCGLDVGKTEHHATALTAAGERVFDKPLPQDEAHSCGSSSLAFRTTEKSLLVVGQPNTIGALPVAVHRDCGCDVAYLPGLAMRKAADLYPGKSKTDVLTELTGPSRNNRGRCRTGCARSTATARSSRR
jgi:Transposase